MKNPASQRITQFSFELKDFFNLLIAGIFVFSLCSCSVTKKLPPHEKLYTGARVRIEDENVKAKQQKALVSELEGLVRPKPNKAILGIPFKLMFYNLIDTTHKKKGLKYFIKYKLGEPPVLFSQVSTEANNKIINNRLENRGFFHTECSADIVEKKQSVKVIYTAVPGPQYFIRNVEFLMDSSFELGDAILDAKENTFLKADDPYDLDVIKAERERIDLRLKENGFYYFSSDDILVMIDSTVGDHKVDLIVRIK
ncbi:MAG: hypothetical protein M3R25_11110, partial [Bacteroidota bacterium]|nr:hypothetical protein [Bacteroidota bacterium]